jgi:hypothetical protein
MSNVQLTEIISSEDLTYEAEVQRTEGSGSVALALTNREPESYTMSFGFEGEYNHMRLCVTNWKQGVRQDSPEPKPIGPVDHNKWDHLRIEKQGSTVVCFYNHKEVFRETNGRFARAQLRITTWGARARFRNIKATGTGGIALLEGLPDLPKMEE